MESIVASLRLFPLPRGFVFASASCLLSPASLASIAEKNDIIATFRVNISGFQGSAIRSCWYPLKLCNGLDKGASLPFGTDAKQDTHYRNQRFGARAKWIGRLLDSGSTYLRVCDLTTFMECLHIDVIIVVMLSQKHSTC